MSDPATALVRYAEEVVALEPSSERRMTVVMGGGEVEYALTLPNVSEQRLDDFLYELQMHDWRETERGLEHDQFLADFGLLSPREDLDRFIATQTPRTPELDAQKIEDGTNMIFVCLAIFAPFLTCAGWGFAGPSGAALALLVLPGIVLGGAMILWAKRPAHILAVPARITTQLVDGELTLCIALASHENREKRQKLFQHEVERYFEDELQT